MARPVFIVDGSRTPFLKARSGPGPFTPVDLAVQCGRPLLARQPFAPDAFDQVILGCVNVIADEMNPARVAAREYRSALRERLRALAERIAPGEGERLGDRLALLIDGMYTSAAHLGPDGPAAGGSELAGALLEAAVRG